MHAIWGSPLIIIAVIILLYREIEWACFVGLGVMLLLVPLTGLVGKQLGKLRGQIVGWTDKRTTIMSEIVNGMRVIKFYGWEVPFRCAAFCLLTRAPPKLPRRLRRACYPLNSRNLPCSAGACVILSQRPTIFRPRFARIVGSAPPVPCTHSSLMLHTTLCDGSHHPWHAAVTPIHAYTGGHGALL